MVECSLLPMKKGTASGPKNGTKYGTYLRCYFWGVPGFGQNRWVVAVNIDVDYDKYLEEGMKAEELVFECVRHLNTPLKSRYGKRRKRRPTYGIFQDKPHKFSLKESEKGKYIQAFLVVDYPKSRHFWGEGEKIASAKRRKRAK